MKTALRNVTVTLEEDVARWARIEAARHDTSVSRFLAQILKDRMLATSDYEQAMRRFLHRRPFMKTEGNCLTRDEVHERERFR